VAKFRFQSVLKLRRHREDRRKRDLAGALAVENRRKQAALHYARMRQDHAGNLRRRQQRGSLDVAALIEHKAYIGLLDREIGRQLQSVAAAERETARRRDVLVDAMKDRKALEVLRQRALEARRADEARRETAELDEVAARVHGGGAARER
jgi:flagellar FliJ protein